MKISYSWLKDFIDLPEQPDEVSTILTATGLEVEGTETIEAVRGGLKDLVVGEVLECYSHPNADKLKITKVDIGADEPSQIVCGGPNVAQGQKVVVAPVNTTIHPIAGEPFKIKKAKIRGEVSEGMICAEDEIGLGSSHDGVIVLETDAENGTPVRSIYNIEDEVVFEIGLTPNRGDGASHLGCARDLAAVLDRPVIKKNPKELNISVDNPIVVSVENHEACPRYSGVTLRGLVVKESPDWLKNRLRSIGLEPINNVVDVTNFVLHSLGQPLHAFDADRINGGKVVVKTLPEGSKFKTLDEKERILSSHDLMICDGESNGMCIGGVFGGIHSGVTENTTSIFLESAFFSQDYIRATATKHSLSTDASFRYERGTDPEITVYALQVAANLILDLAGGYAASDIIDIYPKSVPDVTVETSYKTFDRLIGKTIGNDRIISILNSLDIKTAVIDQERFEATVPPYRSEVTRQADLVEEVLRIYGFDNIEVDTLFSSSYLSEFEEITPNDLQKEVSYFLAGKGYSEILTNSITNKDHEDKLGLGKRKAIELLNKSSEDLGILKTSPLYTGLEVIRYNLNRKLSDIKFFEFSTTYHKYETGYGEQQRLSMYLTGDRFPESWIFPSETVSIHFLISPAQDILKKAGIHSPSMTPLDDSNLYEYGVKIKSEGKLIGTVGLLKRNILKYFEVNQPVLYAELDWNIILKKATKERSFQAIPKFPEVRRDLSLVVKKSISYREIEEISFNSEKKLLTRMNVFSVFEGEQIGEENKAYAIAFYLQDSEKTLTDKQIDKSMNRLIERFEKDIHATIRR